MVWALLSDNPHHPSGSLLPRSWGQPSWLSTLHDFSYFCPYLAERAKGLAMLAARLPVGSKLWQHAVNFEHALQNEYVAKVTASLVGPTRECQQSHAMLTKIDKLV